MSKFSGAHLHGRKSKGTYLGEASGEIKNTISPICDKVWMFQGTGYKHFKDKKITSYSFAMTGCYGVNFKAHGDSV